MSKTNAQYQREYRQRAAEALRKVKAAATAPAPEPIHTTPAPAPRPAPEPSAPPATLPDLISAFVASWPADDDDCPDDATYVMDAGADDAAIITATIEAHAANAVLGILHAFSLADAETLAQSPQGAALLALMGGREYVHAVHQWHEHTYNSRKCPLLPPPIPPADLTEWNAKTAKYAEEQAARYAKSNADSAKRRERKERQEREFKAAREAQRAENERRRGLGAATDAG
jgi:hypothetical protein